MLAPLPVTLLLCLSGCSWVGDAAFQERLLEVDDDGDGVPAGHDCDDQDANLSPAAMEIWYDGLDQKCDGGDDYDQDGDRYVAAEHVGKATAGVAGTGELPGGDCDDAEALVSPRQPDTFYDGLDKNCDGVDDYDQDGDGYVPDEYLGLTTTYIDGGGALPGGDCDDLLPTVSPGLVDDWYDGVDTDCAGNDDWDQDGDGYIPDERAADYGPTTYVEGSGGLPDGDCADDDSTVSPGSVDEFYDGIDSDCAADDDYDQDGDGYAELRGGGQDCHDGNPVAYPGARETLGDTADYDCDGGRDSFSLAALSGFTWVGPRAPIFAESSDRIYLSIVAEEIVRATETSTTHYYDSALAVLWLNADPGDGVDGAVAWNANTSDPGDYSVSAGQGFLATDDYLYGVLGLDYGDSRALRLVRYDVDTGGRTAANANGDYAPFDDISVVLDERGDFNVIACEDSTNYLEYIQMPASWTGGFAANVEVADISAADCGLELVGDIGVVYTSEAGELRSYGFDLIAGARGITAGAALPYAPLDLDMTTDWAATTLVMADEASGGVVLYDADGATLLAVGESPLEVAAAEDATGVRFVAWVVPGGGARMAWGTAIGGFTTVDLAVDFEVEDVSIWASGGYVLYAATGGESVAVGLAAY